MLDFYKTVKEGLNANRFVFNDTVCLEYSCPLEAENVALFSQYDYIVHVLSGKKTYKTFDGDWTLTQGQTLYVKKGATIVHQYFDEHYCMLGFIITDDLIHEVLKEIKGKTGLNPERTSNNLTCFEIQKTELLDSYFNSMLVYFRDHNRPPDPILLLKVKELLIMLLNGDPDVKAYFMHISDRHKPSLRQIMENNYGYNLKLEDYAKITHRSLSSFKRDFQKEFGEAPGKWLQNRRIRHAANLILNTRMNISQVAFESGFEDLAHFSRSFKKVTGTRPSEYKTSEFPPGIPLA